MKIHKVNPSDLPVEEVIAWNGRAILVGKLGCYDENIHCANQVYFLPATTHYILLSEIEEEFRNMNNGVIHYYNRGETIWYSETGEAIVCPMPDEHKAKEAKNG